MNLLSLLATAAKLVRSTHERWDGTGYPDALAGEEIPLAARIIAACDVVIALPVQGRPRVQTRDTQAPNSEQAEYVLGGYAGI